MVTSEKPDPVRRSSNLPLLLSIGFELGYLIALPAVIGAFGGAYLDKRWATSPLFLLVGLGLAILTSSLWVWRLIRRLNQD